MSLKGGVIGRAVFFIWGVIFINFHTEIFGVVVGNTKCRIWITKWKLGKFRKWLSHTPPMHTHSLLSTICQYIFLVLEYHVAWQFIMWTFKKEVVKNFDSSKTLQVPNLSEKLWVSYDHILLLHEEKCIVDLCFTLGYLSF